MRNGLKTAALVAAVAAGLSGAALAQTAASVCPIGFYFSDGRCQPSASGHPATGTAVYGSSSAPARINPGPPGFDSYTAGTYKQEWKATTGACPPGDVMASWGADKNGCYPAH